MFAANALPKSDIDLTWRDKAFKGKFVQIHAYVWQSGGKTQTVQVFYESIETS